MFFLDLDIDGAVEDGVLGQGEGAGLNDEGHEGQPDTPLLADSLQLLVKINQSIMMFGALKYWQHSQSSGKIICFW